MVYIVGKKRMVTVNVVKGGKVIKTFSVQQKRMHSDNVVYEGKEYPMQAGNIINLDGKGVMVAPTPPPKVEKVQMMKSFRDWDASVAKKKEAKKNARGKK